MKLRGFGVACVFAAAALLPVRAAYAGFKYLSTIVEDDQNTTDTHLTKPGKSKILIKPSKKKGDGGANVKLLLKFVTCTKCTDNVLELNVRALGNELHGAVCSTAASGTINGSGAGVLFDIQGGTAVFANGKNKTGLGGSLGALATAVFEKPLGIGLLKLRTTASNPADCGTAPLLPGNGCNDGDLYAFTGIVVKTDSSLLCTSDDQCSLTQNCVGGICATAQCFDNSECKEGALCNINEGTCCDPVLTPATCF